MHESRHDGQMLFIERLVERKGVVVGSSWETGGSTSSFRVREYASDVNSTERRSGGPLQLQLHTRAAMQAACDRESTLRLPSAGRLA